LQQSKASSISPYHGGLSPPRLHDSPGLKERQVSNGPLPALNSVGGPVPHPAMTPPTRNHSITAEELPRE
jgi:hypothetical protein